MKLRLLNTTQGLIPLYDEDYDEKKRLKVGETYEAEIRLKRNVRLHNKFFSLLNIAWEYLPGETQDGFRSKDGFRQYVTVAAGYYDTYFNPRLNEFVEVPKSIAFDNMDNAEFTQLYESVKAVIWRMIGNRVQMEEFEKVLSNF